MPSLDMDLAHLTDVVLVPPSVSTGPQGPAGPIGPTGPLGATGPAGSTGLNRSFCHPETTVGSFVVAGSTMELRVTSSCFLGFGSLSVHSKLGMHALIPDVLEGPDVHIMTSSSPAMTWGMESVLRSSSGLLASQVLEHMKAADDLPGLPAVFDVAKREMAKIAASVLLQFLLDDVPRDEILSVYDAANVMHIMSG